MTILGLKDLCINAIPLKDNEMLFLPVSVMPLPLNLPERKYAYVFVDVISIRTFIRVSLSRIKRQHHIQGVVSLSPVSHQPIRGVGHVS